LTLVRSWTERLTIAGCSLPTYRRRSGLPGWRSLTHLPPSQTHLTMKKKRMKWTSDYLETLRVLTLEGRTAREIASEFNCTTRAVENARANQRAKARRQGLEWPSETPTAPLPEHPGLRGTPCGAEIVSKPGKRTVTIEELLETMQIDQTEWLVERAVANRWEVGRVVNGEITIEPLYQVKVWLRKAAVTQDSRTLWGELIEEIRRHLSSRTRRSTSGNSEHSSESRCC